MFTKKAQAEIMGLLIIVILVIMIIFIVISFSVSEQPRDIHQTYFTKQISETFILSLLDTSTDCAGVSLREVISDCAVGRRLACNSCDYLNNTLKDIFKDTLSKWGISHNFNLNHMSFNEYKNFTFKEGCNNTQVYSRAIQVIPLWPRHHQVRVNLEICAN